ncbi:MULTISPECIES: hypothetical protein [Pseudomonas]|uniref:Uncharacterized protein n=1 Tax=Pseudomonas oryziphila TaxID=2894079 RepID=A0ABN5TGJ2_9PSED|nr:MULTISPECIES: hypothetical protein [Pseudomonas]AZL74284.1 hypothetical protein EI693_14855 [Pseudomonas oryziphila]
MSKTDLETLIRENPEYGGVAQKSSASAIFKGKMIWPSGRMVTLKPVSVYLKDSESLKDYVQAVAILDAPLDRVVVSIRKDSKDNVYPVTSLPAGDVAMGIIYEGLPAKEVTGNVGFRHNAGNLEIYMIEVAFKLEFSKIQNKDLMAEWGKNPSPGEMLTFKLSEGHFMF